MHNFKEKSKEINCDDDFGTRKRAPYKETRNRKSKQETFQRDNFIFGFYFDYVHSFLFIPGQKFL